MSTKVFTRQSLAAILEENQERRIIPNSVSLKAFIAVLEGHGELRSIQLLSVSEQPEYRPFARYVWGTPSVLSVALSLRPRSYLSHATAMVLNNLRSESPKRAYVNQEQSPKPASASPLAQASVDRAFQNRARLSNYIFEYDGMELVLLNGKNTGNFGVAEFTDRDGESYPATNLERTLIDIVVRPSYADGATTVLNAFRSAREQRPDKSLVRDLIRTLRVIGHVYPYHQAIGFYLSRVGVSPKTTAPLRKFGLDLDFYLENQMAKPMFDANWRIYYPRGLPL